MFISIIDNPLRNHQSLLLLCCAADNPLRGDQRRNVRLVSSLDSGLSNTLLRRFAARNLGQHILADSIPVVAAASFGRLYIHTSS